MTSWIDRDRAVIADSEKVRFFDLAIEHGSGSVLVTEDQRRIIDLSATWTAAGLGYADHRIRDAVAAVLDDTPGFGLGSLANPQSIELAESLIALTPVAADRVKVYFGHSGSDANDIAVRLCRRNSRPDKQKVLAFEHSYHGGFGESLGFSGVQVEGGATPDAAVDFLPYPNPDHPHEPGAGIADELEYSLVAVRASLSRGDAACLIVEPILSDGGMVIPPDGFLRGLRQLCDEYSVPLICDEVKIGLGRPGTLHAFEYEEIRPDVVTLGKALGGGLPISAIVGDARLLDSPRGSALLTMGGNPVSAAAAIAVLRAIVTDDLPSVAGRKGAVALRRLRETLSNLSPAAAQKVSGLRGRGLAIGLELDDGALESSAIFAEKVVFRCAELGVLVYYVGGHVLEITPALTIPDQELGIALDIIGQAIEDVTAGAVDDDQIRGFGGW